MSRKLTREERDKLNRKRALNPALTGAAAGASGAALATQLGGTGLRNLGQKKTFNSKTGEYGWSDRKGASPRRVKASRVGSKLQAKAIPLTLAAGGLNAVAAANGIQMSHLWNKKDRVYDNVKKSRNDYRTLEEIDRRATRQRSKKRDAMAVSSLAAGSTVASLSSNRTYRQAKKFARDTKPLVTRMGPGAKDPWGKKIPISRQVRGLGQGISRNAKLAPRGAAVAGGLALAGAAAGKAGYHKSREVGYQQAAASRRKSKFAKNYNPEAKYRKGQRRRSDASYAVGGAGLGSAAVLGAAAGRDAFSARKSRMGAQAHRDAATKATFRAYDQKYAPSTRKKAAKDAHASLTRASQFDRAAKFRAGRAKVRGAGAIGAATLGAAALANAGRHKKNERDQRAYRRRQWAEPIGKTLYLGEAIGGAVGPTVMGTLLPSQAVLPVAIGQTIGGMVPQSVRTASAFLPANIAANQGRKRARNILSPALSVATGMALAQPVAGLFGRRTKENEYRPGVRKSAFYKD